MMKRGLSFVKGVSHKEVLERKSKSFVEANGHVHDRSKENSDVERKANLFVYRTGSMGFKPPQKRRILLLIDPQNDFIAEWGTLKVPGAVQDSVRIAEAIGDHAMRIDQIVVTLDTHQRMHIAHPLFWKAPDGTHPKPFTEIHLSEVREGKWKPTVESLYGWTITYLIELQKDNKFRLTIWPEHCLVGTKGHAVFDPITTALQIWEGRTTSAVSYLLKGNNALTEHYSCFRAEVPRPDDPLTDLNVRLITLLDSYDEIVIAGQALSHCVNHSVRDLVANLSPDSRRKIIVLEDGTSVISGFEEVAKEFQADMKKVGVKFMVISEVFPSY